MRPVAIYCIAGYMYMGNPKPYLFTILKKSLSLTPRSHGPPSRGGSQERYLSFYDRPSTRVSTAPVLRGRSVGRSCTGRWGDRISRMRTFSENSCALSITHPRSLPLQNSPPNPSAVAGERGLVSPTVQTRGFEGETPRRGGNPATRGTV